MPNDTFSKKLEAAIASYLSAGNFEIDTFTAAPATNVLTTPLAHRLELNDRVRLTTTGALPTPLLPNTNYFVVSLPGTTTLSLSATSGGPVIDITNAGTGTHKLHVRPPVVDGSEGWVIYESHSSGQREARFHVVVECGGEYGGAMYAGVYHVDVELSIYRLAKRQPADDFTPIQQLTDTSELLAWIFNRHPEYDRVFKVNAALEAIDPTLRLSGYWPGDRRDEGVTEAFQNVLPFVFSGANA